MTDPLKVVRSLLVTEMGVASDRVFLYNAEWTIPKDEGMFLLVTFDHAKPYSTATWYEDTAAGLTEIQEIATQETYSVDVFSRSTEARDKRNGVIFALNSTAAQQACEAHNLKFSNIPSVFIDLSHIEAAARLSRYRLTFNVLRLERREKVAPYYDQFSDPTLLIEP